MQTDNKVIPINNIPDNKLKLLDVENFRIKSFDFAWNPYIPKRFVTLIHGESGSAKTLFTMNLFASASLCKSNEHIIFDKKIKTVFIETEDPMAEMFVPRMRACGYDKNNFKIIDRVGKPLFYDDEELLQIIKNEMPDVVVFDVLKDLLPNDANINDSGCMRKVLNYLKGLAEKYNIAVVVTHHNNKGGGEGGRKRVQGSDDWYSVPRSTLEVVFDKEKECFNVLSHKKNHAEKGGGIGFTISSKKVGFDEELQKDIIAPYVNFCCMSQNIDDVDSKYNAKDSPSKQEVAEDLIIKYIKEQGITSDDNGEEKKYVKATKLEEYILSNNISDKPFREARSHLKRKKIIYQKTHAKISFWYLEP